ncbi:TPA: hypothetical protein ONC98_003003 [Clostridioides difficile]|nr:hypothetical protein [Clostridioides difficile]MDO0498800.1 hypothetical protein [Clostridioides difficile]HCR2111385.1 hypothetical protein [Clostridioides difficile]HCR2116042.1 hypothetical protein [Clostridioides difficile]HCR2120656.1 hypothetical protein [Clostridioides difficile]
MSLDEATKDKLEESISLILDLKERKKSIEENLAYEKYNLLDMLNRLNITEYNSIEENAKAIVMDFKRENLIKDKVMSTFFEVNDNQINKVDISEHIKVSPVCFVSVISRDN